MYEGAIVNVKQNFATDAVSEYNVELVEERNAKLEVMLEVEGRLACTSQASDICVLTHGLGTWSHAHEC